MSTRNFGTRNHFSKLNSSLLALSYRQRGLLLGVKGMKRAAFLIASLLAPVYSPPSVASAKHRLKVSRGVAFIRLKTMRASK